MALKMCKMWSNGIKTTFFQKISKNQKIVQKKWDASPHRELASPHRDLASPNRDLGVPHRDLSAGWSDEKDIILYLILAKNHFNFRRNPFFLVFT